MNLFQTWPKCYSSIKQGLNNLRMKWYNTIQTSSLAALPQTTPGQYVESTNKLETHICKGREKKEPI